MSSKEEIVIETFLPNFNFNNKNVIEFGPCVLNECLGLMKYLKNKSNNFAIDFCNGYNQNKSNAIKLAEELNFNLEIKDYTNALKNPEYSYKLYKNLKINFYDLIYAQCSVENKYIENMMILCNIIGTNNSMVFLMPWNNDDKFDNEYYVNLFSKIDFQKYGFKLYEIKDEFFSKINYLMKYNIIITKNITIPSYMISK